MTNYYQTQPGLSPSERRQFVTMAGTQDDMVLKFFQDRPGLSYSPERVQEIVLPGAPITSVRRSLNTLTNAGLLVKTDQRAEGNWGRPVGMWQLAAQPKVGQLGLFE
jgi:hypothetical protein